ncbi:MAG: hypothetical protein HDQ88_04910 [Clostridia bacterium]|nr:hypothetical protein [Clostridia bacterium]
MDTIITLSQLAETNIGDIVDIDMFDIKAKVEVKAIDEKVDDVDDICDKCALYNEHITYCCIACVTNKRECYFKKL